MPETRPEETGRKRASKKLAGIVKDLAYRPSRKPVLEPRSYNIRQGEPSVSQIEGEAVVSEGIGEEAVWETESLEKEGDNSIEEGECEEEDMAGQGAGVGDVAEVLRMMIEREGQRQEDEERREEQRRKDEEDRRKTEAEVRKAEEEANNCIQQCMDFEEVITARLSMGDLIAVISNMKTTKKLLKMVHTHNARNSRSY